jgi:hypothetical protein
MNFEKIGRVFTGKFVETGLSFYKKYYTGRGLTKVESHWFIYKCGLV